MSKNKFKFLEGNRAYVAVVIVGAMGIGIIFMSDSPVIDDIGTFITVCAMLSVVVATITGERHEQK